MLAIKTLVHPQEKTTPRGKISKHVIILACCNAYDSHKLRLLMIGKKNLRVTYECEHSC